MNVIAHEMGRKDENYELQPMEMEVENMKKNEFFRHLSNHVRVVTLAGNRLGNRKMCVIAHEMGKKYENCDIQPMEMEAENMKNNSFCGASQTMYRWLRQLEIVLGNR